ncbi:MAG: SUMF1/EgtB/PvdO family nonheme iron enzyme [Pseudomonadota bacterium]
MGARRAGRRAAWGVPLLLAILAEGLLAGPTLAAGKRFALIVGIDAYPAPIRSLGRAVADARKAAEELRRPELDYEVELLDETGETTLAAIRVAWQRTLSKAGKGDVVLLYFAGHGIELEGQNFLLPSDARLEQRAPSDNGYDPDRLKSSAVDFQQLLAELGAQQSKDHFVGIFIIDACRENPYRWSGGSARSLMPGSGKHEAGLAPPVSPPREVFIMYSAGIGQQALDGDGDEPHSVYAAKLHPLLSRPDLPLSDLALRIRRDVYLTAAERNHMQTPAYYDQLTASLTIRGESGQPERVGGSFLSRIFKPMTRSLAARDILIDCDFCPDLVVVGSGTFTMGAADSETEASDHERPAHPVSIEARYAIGKFEVTNAEWNTCVDAGGCVGRRDLNDRRRALQPVTDVSWYDALSYVAWLASYTGKPYRLPTEAEWEFAARAGQQSRYSFGDDPGKLCQFANGADRRAGPLIGGSSACDDGVGREPAQRGSYLPNRLGLFDMHGNVWEWVDDCWRDNYAVPAATRSASAGGNGACATRAARGGSWRSGPAALRSAVRHAFPAGHRRVTLGFRVARTLGPNE